MKRSLKSLLLKENKDIDNDLSTYYDIICHTMKIPPKKLAMCMTNHRLNWVKTTDICMN